MANKFLCLAICLCAATTVFGDIESLRNEKLQKIRNYETAVYKAYDEVCNFYNTRPNTLKEIKNRNLDLGLSIKEAAIYEVNQTVLENQQRIDILHSVPEVKKCILAAESKAVKQESELYAKKFLQPLEVLYNKADKEESQISITWNDEHFGVFHEFETQTDRAIEEIKRTNSQSYLQSLYKHFEKVANTTLDFMESFPLKIFKTQLKFNRNLRQTIAINFREDSNTILDTFFEEVKNCFK